MILYTHNATNFFGSWTDGKITESYIYNAVCNLLRVTIGGQISSHEHNADDRLMKIIDVQTQGQDR